MSMKGYQSPYGPPCPPIHVDKMKWLVLPQLYIQFQPDDLKQFSPMEALKHGTLWPALYSPYHNPYESLGKGGKP